MSTINNIAEALTSEWHCAGCGVRSPGRQRMCDCWTNIVTMWREGVPLSEWKCDPSEITTTSADNLVKALELIADEQKVYKGNGDFDILPALDADEAQSVARKALAARNQPAG